MRCLFEEFHIIRIALQRNSKTALEIPFHQKAMFRSSKLSFTARPLFFLFKILAIRRPEMNI